MKSMYQYDLKRLPAIINERNKEETKKFLIFLRGIHFSSFVGYSKYLTRNRTIKLCNFRLNGTITVITSFEKQITFIVKLI